MPIFLHRAAEWIKETYAYFTVRDNKLSNIVLHKNSEVFSNIHFPLKGKKNERKELKFGERQTATKVIEEVVCDQGTVKLKIIFKKILLPILCREVLTYRMNGIDYSILYSDRNISFYSLADSVVPNKANIASVVDPLDVNEQLVRSPEPTGSR